MPQRSTADRGGTDGDGGSSCDAIGSPVHGNDAVATPPASQPRIFASAENRTEVGAAMAMPTLGDTADGGGSALADYDSVESQASLQNQFRPESRPQSGQQQQQQPQQQFQQSQQQTSPLGLGSREGEAATVSLAGAEAEGAEMADSGSLPMSDVFPGRVTPLGIVDSNAGGDDRGGGGASYLEHKAAANCFETQEGAFEARKSRGGTRDKRNGAIASSPADLDPKSSDWTAFPETAVPRPELQRSMSAIDYGQRHPQQARYVHSAFMRSFGLEADIEGPQSFSGRLDFPDLSFTDGSNAGQVFARESCDGGGGGSGGTSSAEGIAAQAENLATSNGALWCETLARLEQRVAAIAKTQQQILESVELGRRESKEQGSEIHRVQLDSWRMLHVAFGQRQLLWNQVKTLERILTPQDKKLDVLLTTASNIAATNDAQLRAEQSPSNRKGSGKLTTAASKVLSAQMDEVQSEVGRLRGSSSETSATLRDLRQQVEILTRSMSEMQQFLIMNVGVARSTAPAAARHRSSPSFQQQPAEQQHEHGHPYMHLHQHQQHQQHQQIQQHQEHHGRDSTSTGMDAQHRHLPQLATPNFDVAEPLLGLSLPKNTQTSATTRADAGAQSAGAPAPASLATGSFETDGSIGGDTVNGGDSSETNGAPMDWRRAGEAVRQILQQQPNVPFTSHAGLKTSSALQVDSSPDAKATTRRSTISSIPPAGSMLDRAHATMASRWDGTPLDYSSPELFNLRVHSGLHVNSATSVPATYGFPSSTCSGLGSYLQPASLSQHQQPQHQQHHQSQQHGATPDLHATKASARPHFNAATSLGQHLFGVPRDEGHRHSELGRNGGADAGGGSGSSSGAASVSSHTATASTLANYAQLSWPVVDAYGDHASREAGDGDGGGEALLQREAMTPHLEQQVHGECTNVGSNGTCRLEAASIGNSHSQNGAALAVLATGNEAISHDEANPAPIVEVKASKRGRASTAKTSSQARKRVKRTETLAGNGTAKVSASAAHSDGAVEGSGTPQGRQAVQRRDSHHSQRHQQLQQEAPKQETAVDSSSTDPEMIGTY
ncbi:hypothetical protein ACQY0O_003756 [Thecaphora frezii]